MNKNYKLIGGSAILSLCVAAGFLTSSQAQAQEAYVQSRPCVQCEATPRSLGGRVCIPNTQNWGYYTPTWRVWPNERRPDVTFPQAIGAERVPTPAGFRPENVPGPQNPRQSLIDDGSEPGRVNITGPKDDSLPTINFDSGSNPFEPTEMLPPTEPIPQTPAPTAEPAPVTEPDLTTEPEQEAEPDLTSEFEPSTDPVPEIDPVPVTEPDPVTDDVPIVDPVQTDPTPTDSFTEPILLPGDGDEEKPAEQPAPTVPKMDDVIPNFDPIVDPSLGANPIEEIKSADNPTTSQPSPMSDDAFSIPPLSQIEPETTNEPIMPMDDTPTAPLYEQNNNVDVNPLRQDDSVKQDENKPFRSRNTPSQVQSASAPEKVDTAMNAPMRSGDVKPIDSTFSAENPLRQSAAIESAPSNFPPSTTVVPSAPIGSDSDFEPVALEGYSLVDLIKSEKWTPGKPEFAVVFEGRTYYCSNASQRDEFMANPERFTPACRGFDPMLKLQQNRNVDGKVDYCLVYGKKLYVFSSPDTMKQFREHAKQYARQVAEMEQ